MDPAIARLLDANFNRAREGLRVMEDYARFVLDDADLAQRLKQGRHELAACAGAVPAFELMGVRDVAGDVGRTISTPAEQSRTDAVAVVRAAAGRASEAIRCLEEYAKLAAAGATPAAPWSGRFESLRYTVYDCERQMLTESPRRRALREARLHVLVTESVCRIPWREAARAAIAGGAGVIQLREKSMSDRVLLERGRELREITRAAGALLIINDRPDIARLCDADGVHVGQDDLPVHEARKIAGAGRMVGVSTHNLAQFHAALAARPDYIAVGPMFASRTKPQSHTPGPALLREAMALAAGRVPVVCIGGINAGNAGEIAAAGGRCVAVCEAVVGEGEPAAECRRILAQLVGSHAQAR